MALWQPYSDDVALDLSQPKIQEAPPRVPVFSEYQPPRVHGYPQCYALQQPAAPAFPLYGGYGALDKVSPSGTSSGYDSVAPSTPESPIEATDMSDDPNFEVFKQNALRVMAEKNGGALVGNNPRMRRSIHASAAAPADAAYRRQRDRNNQAAKLSRDRRKLREINLELKTTYLKKKVAALEAELKNKVCVNCNRSCTR